MHQVNNCVIKPVTEAFEALPGTSWSLMENMATDGLECTLFISHAWDEGVYEFASNALASWPDDCEGAYICFLSNPQNLDIGNILGTEIEQARQAARDPLSAPASRPRDVAHAPLLADASLSAARAVSILQGPQEQAEGGPLARQQQHRHPHTVCHREPYSCSALHISHLSGSYLPRYTPETYPRDIPQMQPRCTPHLSECVPSLTRYWCVLEIFLARKFRIGRVKICGQWLHLLTGQKRDQLQRLEQRAAELEKQAGAMSDYRPQAANQEAARLAADEEARTKLEAVMSEDCELVDLNKAECSWPADEIKIKGYISGYESSIEQHVARLIRERACAPDASAAPLALPSLGAPVVDLRGGDLSRPPAVLQLAAWIRAQPQVTDLDLRGCGLMDPDGIRVVIRALKSHSYLLSMHAGPLASPPLPSARFDTFRQSSARTRVHTDLRVLKIDASEEIRQTASYRPQLKLTTLDTEETLDVKPLEPPSLALGHPLIWCAEGAAAAVLLEQPPLMPTAGSPVDPSTARPARAAFQLGDGIEFGDGSTCPGLGWLSSAYRHDVGSRMPTEAEIEHALAVPRLLAAMRNLKTSDLVALSDKLARNVLCCGTYQTSQEASRSQTAVARGLRKHAHIRAKNKQSNDLVHAMAQRFATLLIGTDAGRLALRRWRSALVPTRLAADRDDQSLRCFLAAADEVRRHAEAPLATQWLHNGLVAMRLYFKGVALSVFSNKAWVDVVAVAVVDGAHRLQLQAERITLALTPFNHAPQLCDAATFSSQQAAYTEELHKKHARIVDAYSGEQLHIFEQLVRLNVDASGALRTVDNARDLFGWMRDAHATRRALSLGEGVPSSLQMEAGTLPLTQATLITAGPAAGKTTLTSQLIMDAIGDRMGLIPLLIKVGELHLLLGNSTHASAFEQAWNWVDTWVCIKHHKYQRMLRQALLARRLLVIIDGIDEGGDSKSRIEEQVTSILCPQGHPLVVTGRPTGVNTALYPAFHRVELRLLDVEQQAEVR